MEFKNKPRKGVEKSRDFKDRDVTVLDNELWDYLADKSKPKARKRNRIRIKFRRKRKHSQPVSPQKASKAKPGQEIYVRPKKHRNQRNFKSHQRYERRPWRITKKQIVIGAIAAGVLIFVVYGVLVSSNGKPKKPTTSKTGSSSQSGDTASSASPDFTALPPTDDSITPKYDGDRKVVSFADKIGDADITVSQQKLPPNFSSDPTGAIESLAKQFNASTVLTAGATTAYLGNSIKGPQTVIFTTNDLLVFLFSEKKIENQAWQDYITELVKG